MVGGVGAMGTRRIRRAAREGHCEFTLHAVDEMDEDGVTEADVIAVLLKGKLAARLARDRRGVRFVVRGRVARLGPCVEVVCRFLSSGLLRIITGYRVDD